MLSGTVESVSFDGTVAVIFLEGGACIGADSRMARDLGPGDEVVYEDWQVIGG